MTSLTLQSKVSHLESSHIFMMASGKGGVGKTWFSITFAHILARQGKKVLLFDGDLGLANIDIQLGIAPSQDLGNVIAGDCTLKEAIFRFEKGRYDIIVGRSGSGSLSSLSSQRLILLREEIKAVAQAYDVVLIDLGAGVGGTVQALSLLATGFIIVTMDEPTALTDAYAFIKHTIQASQKMPIGIVVNQVESHQGGEKTFEVLEKVCRTFLQQSLSYLGSIRRDLRVRETIRSQELIAIRYPYSHAMQDAEVILNNFIKLSLKKG